MNLMVEITNFVNENYLKIVIGCVLVLMAIIGYYAEKTNFGNKLKKENKKENNVDIDNVGLNDYVENNSMVESSVIENNSLQEERENVVQMPNQTVLDSQPENVQEQSVVINDSESPILTSNNEMPVEENKEVDLEADFEKILPEDESINNDLMVDINNMQIDPIESVDVSNNNVYAKLSSNIELPEINDFESSGDVWKF